MDPDLLLASGLTMGALTLPAFLAAWHEGRAPRVGAALLVAAGVLIVLATLRKPGGYTLSEVPGIVIGVYTRLLN